MQDFIEKNIQIVRYGGIVILVIEALAVLSACVLSVTGVNSGKDRYDDDAYQPFFATSYPSAYAGGAPVNYNSRTGAAKYFNH